MTDSTSDKPQHPPVEIVFDYEAMVEQALRDVPRQVLSRVAREGLPGEHHCYITLDTRHPGVMLHDSVRPKIDPDGRLTLVLQHSYTNLKVDDEAFTVDLSFGGVWRTVRVPFAAMTGFVDPHARFGLAFKVMHKDEQYPEAEKSDHEVTPVSEAGDGAGEVVSLDAFRRR